jgi:hypothetical protein
MRSMTGVLTLVQEERFQLLGNGEHALFVLAHDAPLEGAELKALQAAGTAVTIDYDDVPGVLVHVAHRVSAASPEARP